MSGDTCDKQAVLEAEGLSVGIGSRPLFEVPSLRVEAGQLLAVHGPSGSGKTTLLRTLAGLMDPLAGEVRLLGQSGDQQGWPRFRSRMPLVPQEPVLAEGSVEGNLARPLRFASAGRRELPRMRTAELLERLGLPRDMLGRDAGSLSAGQRQRVCLVRALLLEPWILLLDEPTGALDEAAAERTGRLLREMAAEGLAAVIATHQTGFADRWCDRTLDLAGLPHKPETGPP